MHSMGFKEKEIIVKYESKKESFTAATKDFLLYGK